MTIQNALAIVSDEVTRVSYAVDRGAGVSIVAKRMGSDGVVTITEIPVVAVGDGHEYITVDLSGNVQINPKLKVNP
jgi:predicted RecB family endonuclease